MPEWSKMSSEERAASEREDSQHAARKDALRIGRRFESALDHYATVFGALRRIDEGWLPGDEEDFRYSGDLESAADVLNPTGELPPDTPSES
jgi:hypothetical protein